MRTCILYVHGVILSHDMLGFEATTVLWDRMECIGMLDAEVVKPFAIVRVHKPAASTLSVHNFGIHVNVPGMC